MMIRIHVLSSSVHNNSLLFTIFINSIIIISTCMAQTTSDENGDTRNEMIAIVVGIVAGLCLLVACKSFCNPCKKRNDEEIKEVVRIIPIGTNVPMGNANQQADQFWEEEKPKSAKEIFDEGEQASKDHRNNLDAEKARKKAQLEARLQARKKKKKGKK